jgi:ABC-type nitrate/sulfonate/bicarbonate transport system substrate-binding protein
MKERYLLYIVIALLALQSGIQFATYQRAEPVVVADAGEAALPVVRYVGFKVYDPVYVALERGMFEGIQVDLVGDTLGGPTAIQAVAGGQADAGLSSIPAIINANAAGLPITGVSDIQSALAGQPLEYYYVRADSDIKSIEDLKGKTFAVNLWYSSFHYTAIMALEQTGLAEEDIDWVLLPFDQQLPALLEGRVDIIGLMEPYNAAALATGGADIRPLFDAEEIFGAKQFSLHFINSVWAEYNPDLAQAFVAGIVDAIAWIEANQDEAKAIIAEYTGIDREYVPEYHFQPGGVVVEEDIAFWLDYLVGRGDVEVTWLKPERIGTNQFRP